jgi:phage baseplate assembly protein W
MGNISFDFSKETVVHPKGKENTAYVYKDVGTSNMHYYENEKTGEIFVNDKDSSNINADAVRTALLNILNFRSGDEILDPEFGIGKVYQMLYTPYDKYTTQKMINTLKDIIATYEPRIQVVSMPVSYNEDKQEFSITINYVIPELMMDDTLQISLQK